RPAQNHRGCLRSINGWWQPGQMVDPQGAIVGVRTQDRHVGHTVTKPKPAYVIAELINFPDDVVTDYERRTPKTGLWIEVAPNQRVRVLHARGKHMHPHFSPVGRRHGSLDHLQLVRAAEASDLNNPVARLAHVRGLLEGHVLIFVSGLLLRDSPPRMQSELYRYIYVKR